MYRNHAYVTSEGAIKAAEDISHNTTNKEDIRRKLEELYSKNQQELHNRNQQRIQSIDNTDNATPTSVLSVEQLITEQQTPLQPIEENTKDQHQIFGQHQIVDALRQNQRINRFISQQPRRNTEPLIQAISSLTPTTSSYTTQTDNTTELYTAQVSDVIVSQHSEVLQPIYKRNNNSNDLPHISNQIIPTSNNREITIESRLPEEPDYDIERHSDTESRKSYYIQDNATTESNTSTTESTHSSSSHTKKRRGYRGRKETNQMHNNLDNSIRLIYSNSRYMANENIIDDTQYTCYCCQKIDHNYDIHCLPETRTCIDICDCCTSAYSVDDFHYYAIRLHAQKYSYSDRVCYLHYCAIKLCRHIPAQIITCMLESRQNFIRQYNTAIGNCTKYFDSVQMIKSQRSIMREHKSRIVLIEMIGIIKAIINVCSCNIVKGFFDCMCCALPCCRQHRHDKVFPRMEEMPINHEVDILSEQIIRL